MAELIQIIKNNCLAKALYDNHAESQEELEFKKGDVLTVLEQNPNGLQGWWLCALRGRQGIAPGNRLRLLPYMYDPTGLGFATGMVAQTTQPHQQVAPTSCTLPNRGSSANRRPQWRSDPPSGARVVLPVRQGDVYVYDTPQVGGSGPGLGPGTGTAGQKSEYDVPAAATLPRAGQYGTREPPKLQTFASPNQFPIAESQNYDEPKSSGQYDIPRGISPQMKSLSLDKQYDIPKGHSEYDTPAARSAVAPLKAASLYDKPPTVHSDLLTFKKEKTSAYDVPAATATVRCLSGVSLNSHGSSSGVTGSQSSLNTSLSSGGGSNRSSIEQQAEEAYDIPHLGAPKRPLPATTYDSPGSLLTKPTKPASVYDVPPQVTRDRPLLDGSSLRPSLEAADYAPLPLVSTLQDTQFRELHLELHSALETLVIHQQEVHAAIQLVFGSLPHSRETMRVPCHTLLNSVTKFFHFSQGTVQSARNNAQDPKIAAKLERLVQNLGISFSVISESCTLMDKLNWTHQEQGERDDLDRLIACARGLTDDIQQISSCIQGNATLIFRRSPLISEIKQRPLPPTPKVAKPPAGVKADQEYDYIQMQNDIPKGDFGANYDSLLKRSQEMIADKSSVAEVPAHIGNDHMLREYYSPRLNESISYLTEAIDAFLATIEKNQPPRVFVEHTKFILIGAHRVACIGDTLHRHLSDYNESDKFRRCSEKISTSLRLLVDSTKRAALHFPAVVAIQEMVDTVMAVSHLCHALKGCFVVNTAHLQQVADGAVGGGLVVN